MTRLLILTAAVVVVAAHPLHAGVAVASRVLTATIPAARLTHIDLRALDGMVDLSADARPDAADVTISVTLDPPRMRNLRRPPAADLAAVALDWAADANVLRVGLRNGAVGNVEASWTITVPARFSARIDAHDGGVMIYGLSGGVDASLNAGLGGHGGTIDVRVPAGRLDLALGVGDIRATRASADFGRAEVRSTVGDASLYLLGHEIVAPHRPGPGHRVVLDGRGPESLSVRVSVGAVTLRIG